MHSRGCGVNVRRFEVGVIFATILKFRLRRGQGCSNPLQPHPPFEDGLLENSVKRQKWRPVPGGGREDICDHGLSQKVADVNTFYYEWSWRVKVIIKKHEEKNSMEYRSQGHRLRLVPHRR